MKGPGLAGFQKHKGSSAVQTRGGGGVTSDLLVLYFKTFSPVCLPVTTVHLLQS